MNSYRVSEKIEEVPSFNDSKNEIQNIPEEKVIEIFEVDSIDGNKCPFCFEETVKFVFNCSPSNRYRISVLSKKKYFFSRQTKHNYFCTMKSWHKHYFCSSCKTNIIIKSNLEVVNQFRTGKMCAQQSRWSDWETFCIWAKTTEDIKTFGSRVDAFCY